MPDPPKIHKSDRELLEDLHRQQLEAKAQLEAQMEINARREAALAEINAFQEQQEAINANRERTLAKMNQQIETNTLLLRRLSSIWLPDTAPDGEARMKSHAIGTWSGWKVLAGVFTVLGGLVLAYQIIVPVVVALHNALISVTPIR